MEHDRESLVVPTASGITSQGIDVSQAPSMRTPPAERGGVTLDKDGVLHFGDTADSHPEMQQVKADVQKKLSAIDTAIKEMMSKILTRFTQETSKGLHAAFANRDEQLRVYHEELNARLTRLEATLEAFIKIMLFDKDLEAKPALAEQLQDVIGSFLTRNLPPPLPEPEIQLGGLIKPNEANTEANVG